MPPERMRAAWISLLLIVVLACAGLARLQPQTEIAGLLSHVDDRDAVVSILEAFGSQPPVFVHLVSDAGPDALVAAADAAALRLQGDPRVAQLVAGVSDAEALAAQQTVSSLSPLLADAADPKWQEPEAIAAAVDHAISVFASVTTPTQRLQAQRDPYDWTTLSFAELGAGRAGPSVTLHEGRLLALDLKSAFLLVVPTTAPEGTIAAVQAAQEAADAVEAPVEGFVTGPGAIAANAEAGVRRDMERSLAWTGALLLALFLFVFRDPWAPTWLVIPASAAAAASAGLVGWFGWEVHGLALAFGSALIGLCVDFPLHLLVDATSEQRAGSATPWKSAAANVARPATACVLTSVLGFGLFLLSGSPLLNQLGMLGVPALVLAALLGVGLLSAVGAWRGWRTAGGVERTVGRAANSRTAVVASIVCVALIAGAPFLELDGDPQRLHAPDPEVSQRSARFDQTFGLTTAPVMVAVHAPTRAGALEQVAAVAAALRSLPPDAPQPQSLLTPTDSLPPNSELGRRCRALGETDVDAWKARLDPVVTERGLRPAALAPFFDRLRTTPSTLCPDGTVDTTSGDIAATPMVKGIFDRYVRERDGVATASMYVFADGSTERIPTEWREAVAPVDPDAAWMYFPELGADSGRGMLREVLMLGGVGLLLALLLLRGVLGGTRAAMLALLPAAVGMLGTVGLFGWLSTFGQTLPAVGLGSILLVLGLGVDDGIYVVHALETKPERMPAVRRAILLTTVTSVVGFGVLALANSPALSAIGQVAVVGLLLDLVAAVGIVPALSAWLSSGRASD